MQLLEHFASLTLHPKNAQELKGLILQLAIQGKLTANWRKKNPDIEFATILLEKVKEEKIKLIKEKKIKKEKSLPLITNEEIPFKIPNSWKWCRLQEYLDVRDGTHDTPKYVDKGFPLVTSKNLYTKKLDLSNIKYISEKDHLEISKRSNVEKNDILFAMIGSIGNPVIVDIEPNFSIKNVALIKYYLKEKTIPHFILFFLEYATNEFKDNSDGAVQSFVSLTKLRMKEFPLPPLEEQKEIVRIVEILFKEVTQLEQLTVERIALKNDYVTSALQQLTTQNSQIEWQSLQPHFKDFFTEKSTIKKLRETVLQLAVQGKLTADWRTKNTDFEPASELLKRIQKEKVQLIKDKKIKKESLLPAITKEEIPYELPEGWVWCRMRDVSYSIVPNRDKPKSFTGNITWLTTRNFKLESNKIHHKEDDNKLSENELNLYNARLLPIHSVVMSCVGQFGLSAVLEQNYSCNQQLHCFVPLGTVNPFYLDSVIKNSKKILESTSSATTIAYLNKTKCDSLVVALPPLEEQKAIVEKVSALMGLCDALEQEVENSKGYSEQLMQRVLREVFEREKVFN